MRKLQVFFVSSWYPVDKNPNYGIFIKEHAKAIHSAEIDIVVLALVVVRDKDIFNLQRVYNNDSNNVKTNILEIHTRFFDIVYHLLPLQYLILKSEVGKIIRNGFKPDLIHSNVIFPIGIISSWLATSLKLPHIITEHWSRLPNLMKNPLFSNCTKNAYQKASVILPVSEFLHKRIIQTIPALTQSKFQIVGNVVDCSTFNYREKTKSDIIRFCAMATWNFKKTPDKLPELFIEALAELSRESEKTIELTMIGGGDKVQFLKDLCMSKGLNAQFAGFLNKSEIAKYLQQADYFLHASTIETFGIVVAEALSCGTPVICSNVGALPELVTQNNGIICKNTVNDWKCGIKTAWEIEFNSKDISENMKNKFGSKQIGSQILSAYKKLLIN